MLFGLAIVGAAFMLSWAAEVAQLDISAGLAIAVLAFIAVLPEYAVDLVFAFKAGRCRRGVRRRRAGRPDGVGESPCSLALANMTGANRLLIGIGWSMVVFIAWYRSRAAAGALTEVALERSHAIELSFLAVATAYSLTLPLKSTVTLLDAAVLVGIFVALHHPHRRRRRPRSRTWSARRATSATFATARGASWWRRSSSSRRRVILLVAEHFAEALVATGRDLHISEFLLVQWLAPLASEAPELLVAGLYAWRLNTNAGLGTLVSSKVNQWTLLVGTLPIVFAIASGGRGGLPVEPRQREELLLTAAQSVFAVATLASLSISLREAALLLRAVLRAVRDRRPGAGGVARRRAHRRVGGLPAPRGGDPRRATGGSVPALLRDGFRTAARRAARRG